MDEIKTYSAFVGESLVAAGPLDVVLRHLKDRFDQQDHSLVLVFDDQSGRQVDFELQGTWDEVLARAMPAPAPARSGPGRPKLGVVSREISLLPRHWEWLEQQPNGASAALRRLVDQARDRGPVEQRARMAKEGAGRFLTSVAGNFPGYEEAMRALYGGNRERFEETTREWPEDVRGYAGRLADGAF